MSGILRTVPIDDVKASTITDIDMVVETLADALVMLHLEYMFRGLENGFLYDISEYLQPEGVKEIEVALKNGMETGGPYKEFEGSLSQVQRKLWGNQKDVICVRVSEKVVHKLRDWKRKTSIFCPREEIEARSKRDWLGKTFALAQTTWFVVQCITRKVQHLPLTEIELIACAYATLSAIIYVFWWNKPFGVQFPIMVHTEIPHKKSKKREMDPPFKPSLRDVTTLANFLAGSAYDTVRFQQEMQVPTFYSGFFQKQESDFWNFIAEVATAAVFGGIHLFAWNYEFPTQIELWLWRLSALVIVGLPPIAIMPISILTGPKYNPTRSQLFISRFSLPIIVLLYIIGHLSILVLSLISLRRHPIGTLTNVNWLTFIPHLA